MNKKKRTKVIIVYKHDISQNINEHLEKGWEIESINNRDGLAVFVLTIIQ